MKSWKIIISILCCTILLAGCGKESAEESKKATDSIKTEYTVPAEAAEKDLSKDEYIANAKAYHEALKAALAKDPKADTRKHLKEILPTISKKTTHKWGASDVAYAALNKYLKEMGLSKDHPADEEQSKQLKERLKKEYPNAMSVMEENKHFDPIKREDGITVTVNYDGTIMTSG